MMQAPLETGAPRRGGRRVRPQVPDPPAGLGPALPASPKEPPRLRDIVSRLAKRAMERRKPAIERHGVNPNDRLTAKKLASVGLFDERAANRAYVAYARMRRDGRPPTVADFFRAHRIRRSPFAVQVLLLPKQLPEVAVDDVWRVEISFGDFAVAAWLLCSFDLATLAFSMMDTEEVGRLTQEQVRAAIAKIYANTLDRKVAKLLDGLGPDVSKRDFADLAAKYSYLLLPAFQTQRAVRDTVFGPTVANWTKAEDRRRRLVRGRTVQQVIRDLAEELPDLRDKVPDEADIYKCELHRTAVLDHAARAYKSGDVARAKLVYGHYDAFVDPAAHPDADDDKLLRKSRALTIMRIDDHDDRHSS